MIESAHAKTAQKLLADRRVSVRFPCNWTALCRLHDDRTRGAWPAIVRDISTRGIGLVMRQPLLPGSQFIVEVQRLGGGSFTAQARVIYAQHEAAGASFVGCVFTARLSAEFLESLLG